MGRSSSPAMVWDPLASAGARRSPDAGAILDPAPARGPARPRPAMPEAPNIQFGSWSEFCARTRWPRPGRPGEPLRVMADPGLDERRLHRVELGGRMAADGHRALRAMPLVAEVSVGLQ